MNSNMSALTMKVCSKCGRTFPHTSEFFYRNTKGLHGFASHCKDCCKGYQIENRAVISPKQKEYRKTRDVELKQRFKRYYQQNRDKILKRCREYDNENRSYRTKKQAEWRNNNKERSLLCSLRRTYRKKNAESNFNIEQWSRCKEYFKDRCAYCGKRRKLTQDHFIPVSRGGEYTVNNIVPACKSCNSSKSNAPFQEWYMRKPFFSEQRMNRIYSYLRYNGDAQQLSIL